MSGMATIDLRIPIGLMFVTIGAVIFGDGVLARGDAARFVKTGGVNINLWWGLVMLAFGAMMLLLARSRRPAAAMPADSTPEGRATERREHDSGLER